MKPWKKTVAALSVLAVLLGLTVFLKAKRASQSSTTPPPQQLTLQTGTQVTPENKVNKAENNQAALHKEETGKEVSKEAGSVAQAPAPVAGSASTTSVDKQGTPVSGAPGTSAVVATANTAAAPAVSRGVIDSVMAALKALTGKGTPSTSPAVGAAPGMPGTPGTPGTTTPAVGNASVTAAVPAVILPPPPKCFLLTYHHKPMSTHADDEDCFRHKNVLTVKAPEGKKVEMAALCVRVNEKPVHYQTVKGQPDQIIIDSIAGPKAKISIRYCVDKAKCTEDCTIPAPPKDEFMEAIGGSDHNGANAGQWDPTAGAKKEADVTTKIDGEVKRELADVNETADGTYIFKDWIPEVAAPVCEQVKTVSNN